MHSQKKLSLLTALFININIMIGTGLFINTTTLAQKIGPFGSLSYLLIGIIMLPLILSIAQLLTIFPAGGFYIFGSQGLFPFAGFISTWIYFFAKLGSATVGIHTFVLLLQQLIPKLSLTPTIVIDTLIISTFLALNMFNITTGGKIQGYLMCIKLTPIVFLFMSGIFLFNRQVFHFSYQDFLEIPSTIPLVLFSLLGFEAVCSLSRNIENAHINGSRAVLISYGLVISLYVAYQTLFYGILGDQFFVLKDYRDVFPSLMTKIFAHPHAQHFAATLAHLAIGSSALSGAYGILFSNQWNLHILAEKKYLLFHRFFEQRNKEQVPFICMITQGIICFFYLIISQGKLYILQQLAALGCTFTYTISVLALLVTLKQRKAFYGLPILGLLNCSILLGVCLYNLYITGFMTLLSFLGIVSIGIIIFILSSNQSQKTIQKKMHTQ